MIMRSTGTFASAMAKEAPQTKLITFFLAWSTVIILLLSAGLICSHNCLMIGSIMIDTNALLSIITFTE